MSDQMEIVLPDVLMRAIKLVSEDPETTPIDAYSAAVLITHGYNLFKRLETYDPRSIAIPTDQWTAIATGLMDRFEGEGKVGISFEWMNRGPSTYERV